MIPDKLKKKIDELDAGQKSLLAKKAQDWLLGLSTINEIPMKDKKDGVLLTEAQKRLYKQCETEDGYRANLVSQRVVLTGEINSEKFIKSLQLVLERHAATKIFFRENDGIVYQCLDNSSEIDVAYNDFSLTKDDLVKFEYDFFNVRLDFQSSNLFRCSLVKVEENTHHFYFLTHNLVFDAWSFSVMMTELKQYYNASVGKSSELPERPINDYLDYVVWQNEWKMSRRYQDELEAWKKIIAPHSDDIKLDRERNSSYGNKGHRIAFDLPVELKSKLSAIGQQQGATLFMTLLATINVFFAKTMGMKDICIGTINANRTRPEVESMIGYFLNLTPIYASVDIKNDKFSDIVGRIKNSVMHSVQNSDVYYEDLVASETRSFDKNRNPFYDVLFSYENLRDEDVLFSGITEQYEDIDKETARYDLTFSIYDEEDRFHGWLEYNTSLYNRETVEVMFKEFIQVVDMLAKHPNQTMDKLES